MEISESGIIFFEKSLCDYPCELNDEMKYYLNTVSLKTKEARKHEWNFANIIEYSTAEGMFSSKDSEGLRLWQHNQDLGNHVDIDGKGDFLSQSFTFAFNVLKKFSKMYPQYILVANILARAKPISVPGPIEVMPPNSRVSFYLYSPYMELRDLYSEINLPEYLLESIFWRFTTFDIPMLEWMIEKAKTAQGKDS